MITKFLNQLRCPPTFKWLKTMWYVMPFTSRTWVMEAGRDEGTTESCSIATLMKYMLLFINSSYTESIWSEKACQVLRVKVTLAQEAQLKLTLCYVSFKMGTEKQEKHTVSITFLFTSEGHKAIWEP
jgi:hypothetical protein